jgi:stage V sporulation protein G
MDISEVRIKLVPNSAERLRAFCSVTLDGAFVIRDLKVIEGGNGVFVAMPSRKLADRCPRCRAKNHLRARFCNECGSKLKDNRAPKDSQGRAKLHADVAHPINAEAREQLQTAVIEAYESEVERSKAPDYQPPQYDDFDDFDYDFEDQSSGGRSRGRRRDRNRNRPREREASSVADEIPEKRPEPGVDVPEVDADSDFSDYNALIAELQQDAAGRRDRRPDYASRSPVDFGPTGYETDDEKEIGPDEAFSSKEAEKSADDRSEPENARRPHDFEPGEESSEHPETSAVSSSRRRDDDEGDDFGAGLR